VEMVCPETSPDGSLHVAMTQSRKSDIEKSLDPVPTKPIERNCLPQLEKIHHHHEADPFGRVVEVADRVAIWPDPRSAIHTALRL
jgi:hypothetical protein